MRKKKANPRPEQAVPFMFTCRCGKRAFDSKKAAKTRSRQVHPGEKLQHYRCGNNWHYGHSREDGTR